MIPRIRQDERQIKTLVFKKPFSNRKWVRIICSRTSAIKFKCFNTFSGKSKSCFVKEHFKFEKRNLFSLFSKNFTFYFLSFTLPLTRPKVRAKYLSKLLTMLLFENLKISALRSNRRRSRRSQSQILIQTPAFRRKGKDEMFSAIFATFWNCFFGWVRILSHFCQNVGNSEFFGDSWPVRHCNIAWHPVTQI